MKAIVVTDQAAGTAGMKLVERPEPQAAINDVVVQVHASGFVGTELAWPSTWTDRRDRDRTPSIPGHELAGVVTALGYGTTGLSVGQRVFGLADWHRDGTLAEYVAIEARNLAPLPGDVDFTVGASLPISGLTAWQGLFQHGRLQAGKSVLAHGAAGAVGSMVTQLAREAGGYVIGTGRAADRQKALDFGAQEFVDLDNDALEDVGGVDLVFDVIGGDIQKRSAGLIRAGGTLVSIVGPTEARPADGLAVDFVVESDRAQLSEIVQRVRDGRLRTNIGNVSTLDDAVVTFNATERARGRRSSAFVRERHAPIDARSRPALDAVLPLARCVRRSSGGWSVTSGVRSSSESTSPRRSPEGIGRPYDRSTLGNMLIPTLRESTMNRRSLAFACLRRRGRRADAGPACRDGRGQGDSALPAGHRREIGREGRQGDSGGGGDRTRRAGPSAPPHRPGVRVRPGRRVRARPQRRPRHDLQGRGHVLRAVRVRPPGDEEPEREGEDTPPRGDPPPPRHRKGHGPGGGRQERLTVRLPGTAPEPAAPAGELSSVAHGVGFFDCFGLSP